MRVENSPKLKNTTISAIKLEYKFKFKRLRKTYENKITWEANLAIAQHVLKKAAIRARKSHQEGGREALWVSCSQVPAGHTAPFLTFHQIPLYFHF